jgi:hypothetical protein
MTNLDFTFKTDAEYSKARFTGFIPEYKVIRMKIERGSNTYDFPCHSEEEFRAMVKLHKHNILDVYPSTTFYEWDEY